MIKRISKTKSRSRTPSIRRLTIDWLACDDGRSVETRRKHEQAIGHLVAIFGNRSINTITVADAKAIAGKISAKYTGRKLAKGTVAKRLQTIKQFGQWCCDAQYVDHNPFDSIKPGQGKPDVTRRRFVSDAEVEKLLRSVRDPEWRVVIVLARYCGLRIPSELVGLRWEHIDWETEQIRIVEAKSDVRFCPLFHRHVADELRSLRDELERVGCKSDLVFGRWTLRRDSNLRTQLNRFVKAAGLEPWPRVFHNQRASRCTELVNDKGLSRKEVSTYMGNSEEVIFEHYEVMRPSTIKRIVKL
jgi:integrase